MLSCAHVPGKLRCEREVLHTDRVRRFHPSFLQVLLSVLGCRVDILGTS